MSERVWRFFDRGQVNWCDADKKGEVIALDWMDTGCIEPKIPAMKSHPKLKKAKLEKESV